MELDINLRVRVQELEKVLEEKVSHSCMRSANL
jgi:hypothetical protein